MEMTGAEIIIQTLIEQGVTDVFGYPGGQVLEIYDELYKSQDKLKHILTAHEQGASHAADGYYRATGKVGVCIATSGPGATNIVTGIATAMLDSSAMVAITGNVSSDLIGKDAFQEVDITGITLPITKHNYFVKDVEKLADTIREAFKIASLGRPGPVLIDVPKDVQCAICEYNPSPKPQEPIQDKIDEKQINEAVKLLNKAKRPYIFIGGGVVGAGIYNEVMEFAEKIDAVIGSTLMGLSAIPTDFDRFLGMHGMHGRYASSMAQNEADVILCVGVRFSDRTTDNRKKYIENAKIIQLDIDAAEINKNVVCDVGIVGDISVSFKTIAEMVKSRKNPKWRALVSEFVKTEMREKEENAKKQRHLMKPENIFEIINRLKGENSIVATDVGQHQMWTAQYCNFSKPRSLISSGGLGTMGFGLGAAIGATVATGERTVLITGDGSFAMSLNELATAVTYNLPITIVIFNNGVLGMVHQWQNLFYEKRYFATVLDRKTDFVKVAEAFGAKGYRVSELGEFESVFKKSNTSSGTVVIDCAISEDEFVLPMLPPGGSVSDIIVKKEKKK